MKPTSRNDEIRWQVMKAMLDEFPMLREKAKEYLKKENSKHEFLLGYQAEKPFQRCRTDSDSALK